MLVRLRDSGAIEAKAIEGEIPAMLERRALLVYCGDFESMDGPVKVTEKHLSRLVSNHNSKLSRLKRLATGDIPVGEHPPVQLDHTRSARDTVGRAVGNLSLEDYELEDGTKVKGIYGSIRFLGRENVEKVADGRWHNLSIQADFDAGKFSEVSVTPFPAAEDASLLSKPQNKIGDTKMFSLMKNRLRRHFKLKKKMSDEQTESELKKLEENPSEEELKKLAEEMDEEDKKKLAAEEEEEKKKKDKDEKLSAAKTNIVRMSTDFRAKANAANISLRSAKVMHRLSAIRSAGKITPAEIKKMDVASLAGKSDETVDAVLKTYEDRQPVIFTGQIGSMRGLSHEELAKKAAMIPGTSMTRKELEVRFDMGRITEAEYRKLSAAAEANTVELSGYIDSDPPQDNALMEAEYTRLCTAIDGGKASEAKDELKKFMTSLRKRGAFAMAEPQMYEQSTVTLSETLKKLAELQTQFDEVSRLAESLLDV